MRERGIGIPQEEIEKAETERHRRLLEERLASHGDLDVEGVPDDAKAAFAYEKQREKEKEIARLWKEADAFEKLYWKYQKETDRGEGFTESEERWFAEGERPEYIRKLALAEAWETMGTLDIEDVPASEKVAFADERLEQLRDLSKVERFSGSEALAERIRRLEVLRDQYAKEAQGGAEAAAS